MELENHTIRNTSPAVAEMMYALIEPKSKLHILEPSAGEGHLIDYLITKLPIGTVIDAIELNHEKVRTLQAKGYNVIGRDYLNTETPLYDVIVACPPFKDNVNLAHIQKMYRDIRLGGSIITLCNTSWLYDNTEKAQEFRKFLTTVNYTMKLLPDNSFMEKGKTVPTLLIKING